MVLIEDDLERTSKYIKSWAKRFVCFDDDTRKISYGTTKDKIKSTMTVTKIVRAAEQVQVRVGGGDYFAVHIEGAADDGKPDTWTVRMPDQQRFDVWYTTIRNCLAAQGLMDPLNYGLPSEDPRNGLPFVNVPLEYLHKFALLEKAILYYFGLATMHGYDLNGNNGAQEHIVMVGDRNLYVFRPNADVLRCVPIETITSLKGPSEAGSKDAFAVVGVQPSEHDIVLKHSTELPKLLEVIAEAYKGVKNSKLAIDNTTSGPIDQWCESNAIAIRPLEGYKMKAMSPTPKSKLKIALDLYQQQHGTTYMRSGQKRSKEDKAAALASAAAANSAAGVSAASATAVAAAEVDTVNDSLSRLLKRVGLPQYTAILRKQHVDCDLLTCMDATDLTNFGIKDAGHCEAILAAAADRDANGSPVEQSLGVVPTGPAAIPAGAGAAAAAPAAAPAKKMVIVLDSDDDEDLMPVMNPASPLKTAGPMSPLAAQSVVILDDSDDDLVVAPPPVKVAPAPAPKPAINLDDDDDI